VTSDLVIITPEASPGSGGVADHTLALLRSWRNVSNIALLVATPGRDAAADLANRVTRLGATRDAIMMQLPAKGGTVFVQYSAYGYDRFGYPRHLVGALIDWKKKTNGRLVVMFHEIWTFWPFTNKNFFVQQFHRRALKRLLQACSAAFTTTASQAEHLQQLYSAVPIQVLPAGSNITPHPAEKVPREDGAAALFGLQSTRVRALEHMHKSLTALAASRQITRIVSLGQGSDPKLHDQEYQLLTRLNLSGGFTQKGALQEHAVSKVLSSVSFGIFGQNELSCNKSGSFMAYAAHQLNVLADFADPSRPPPVCWLVSPSELLNGIARRELDRRAECLRMWQEQNCSWDAIAGRLGRALGIQFERKSSP
jgi:glycosyltransferase involved in cell wall biosynthesis